MDFQKLVFYLGKHNIQLKALLLLLIKEYFPFVPSTLLSSIVEKINQNTDHMEFSHMINGRWENQYLSFHFIPEVLNILRHAERVGPLLENH